VLVGNSKKIVEMLNSGTIDLGFVEGDVTRQKIVIEKLVSDELTLVMPPSHPWTISPSTSISQLKGEPFILREEGSGTRQMIEKHLSKHGLSPQNMNISLIVGSTEAIKGAVELGLGVSILSKWAVRKELENGSLRMGTFSDAILARNFSLVYSKKGLFSNVFERFLEYARTYPFNDILEGRIACTLC